MIIMIICFCLCLNFLLAAQNSFRCVHSGISCVVSIGMFPNMAILILPIHSLLMVLVVASRATDGQMSGSFDSFKMFVLCGK